LSGEAFANELSAWVICWLSAFVGSKQAFLQAKSLEGNAERFTSCAFLRIFAEGKNHKGWRKSYSPHFIFKKVVMLK